MQYGRLWFGFAAVVLASFSVLGYFGREIYRLAPPVPEKVVTKEGEVVFAGKQIKDGQNVWQSLGGQEVGSIWGHGAYVAPDWSADWLHREATYLLDFWAERDHGAKFADLNEEQQAALTARLKTELRTNTLDVAQNAIIVSPDRASAIRAVGQHYAQLFGDDSDLKSLREAYAIPANAIQRAQSRR